MVCEPHLIWKSPWPHPEALALLGRPILSLTCPWRHVQLLLEAALWLYPFFRKSAMLPLGWLCLSLSGCSQRCGSLLTRERRRFMGKRGASKWTHILVRRSADPQMPSIEKGPNCHSQNHATPQRVPDLADATAPTSFPTNLASSLPPGHLLSVDGGGNWARISMSSLYWLPSILIFTVFSLCQEKFLTKGNAIQSWRLSKL